MKKTVLVLGVLLIIILFIEIVVPFYRYNKEQEVFKELADIVDEVMDDSSDNGKYNQLYKINNDIIGWIKIDGTNIDYPVMYREDNEEYYLNHSFYKENSLIGTPFVSINYNSGNNNVLIYGHNIDDKFLFGELLKYGDRDFLLNHQYIKFNTLDSDNIYQIVVVVKTKVFDRDLEVFKYYEMDYNLGEDEFNYYIDNIRDMALYDTGIDVFYGNVLITLSTCINNVKNGRFVVIAKKIM